MSRSVGGDVTHVFSPDVGARAAVIPVGASEADDLMGETSTRKKPRYAEPPEQTPHQKAKDTVRKALGTNPKGTLQNFLKKSSDNIL